MVHKFFVSGTGKTTRSSPLDMAPLVLWHLTMWLAVGYHDAQTYPTDAGLTSYFRLRASDSPLFSMLHENIPAILDAMQARIVRLRDSL